MGGPVGCGGCGPRGGPVDEGRPSGGPVGGPVGGGCPMGVREGGCGPVVLLEVRGEVERGLLDTATGGIAEIADVGTWLVGVATGGAARSRE